jgi:hypothetical protein
MPSEHEPRTLTQMLREWDDDRLVELFRLRPELAFPPPTHFSQLASRATTRHSVASALDELTCMELAAARIAVGLKAPFALTDAIAACGVGAPPHAAVSAAFERLLERGLLWGSERSLRPVRALAALLADEEDSGHVPRPLPLQPPDLSDVPRQRQALVDKAAAGSAFEFVRQIEVVVEHSDHHAARLTQSGGVAARDVRGLARLLDIPPSLAGAHLEVALVGGLVGLAAHELDEALIPTERFDQWRAEDLARQWRWLADAWLRHHLGSGPAEMKRLLLDAYGNAGEGRVLTAADLRGWLAWHRPRRPSSWDRSVPAFVGQSAAVGITGLGALASYALDPATRALAALMPSRVDQVLLQADLTAVAPGPLDARAGAELAAIADVESRGGATVFRFSRESLESARALGWTSEDVLDVLRSRSRTPVPQPLEYLVRDMERRELVATSASLPAAGDEHGHRRRRRAAGSPADEEATPRDRLDDRLAREIVAALREHDQDEGERLETGPYSDSLGATPLNALREAVETQEVVWVGFVDGRGGRHERMATVTSVDDGAVRGRDATSGDALTIPISRVTAAHIIRAAASR